MPRAKVMFSIDQNCHPLWDVVAKLQALAEQGHTVRHFIEDIDVAFTSLSPDSSTMRMARERYYPGGGADWGAALFYSQFLGRLPVDPRNWESLTGMKTKALARELGLSTGELYDRMSPGDNWQLIGPSYAADNRHHRLIGDLSVAETAPFLHEMMDLAQADIHAAFPSAESRGRSDEWFAAQRGRLAEMLTTLADAPLVELYRRWMGRHVGNHVKLELSSELLACGANADSTALMELFTRNYDHLAGLYNQAIEETDSGLRPLKTVDGELPFFAAMELDGQFVRTAVFLEGGGEGKEGEKTLRIADMTFPLSSGRLPIDALKQAGVKALAGKALLLIIQVRLGRGGAALALPYHGSLYTPAAVKLAEKLADENLLPAPLHPIVRVRFHLLDRMAELDTPIRLPAHLAPAFGAEETTAHHFAENWRQVRDAARSRLEAFRTPEGPSAWQKANCSELLDKIDGLDAHRRALAQNSPPPATEIRDVWKQIKSLKAEMTNRMVAQIAQDHQAAELDYWDSRGALLPWCLALGGQQFYNDVIAQAEISSE